MKSVKGTLTEKNLLTSFAGESQARMRYTYFSEEARREGFEQIAAIFLETAEQEKMHAERMFRFLEGGMVEIRADYPAGTIQTTMDNLRAAAAGEHEEWTEMYAQMAVDAREEGFGYIAELFEGVAAIEKEHEERYLKLLENVKGKLVFSRDGDCIWQCRNCGHICVGKEAPEVCPVCNHSQAHFQIKPENY